VLERREAGVELKQQAVLMRAGWHGGALELECSRRNIPFVKYGGLKFLEAAHVKDTLALLRWAENPRDRVAAHRARQVLPGIGPGYARRALAAAEQAHSPATGLRRFKAPAAAREEIAVLAEAIDEKRRLLYVAMTRARERLDLIAPRRLYRGGQRRLGDGHVTAPVSRLFASPVREHLSAASAANGAGDEAPQQQPERVDLKARMRAMWQ
jgi:superfamily I DNA/RNA helicase